jgi:hypothetical protein
VSGGRLPGIHLRRDVLQVPARDAIRVVSVGQPFLQPDGPLQRREGLRDLRGRLSNTKQGTAVKSRAVASTGDYRRYWVLLKSSGTVPASCRLDRFNP